jgi:hypothetical protein
MVRFVDETPEAPPAVIVIGPVAAPAGITNDRPVALALTIGAAMLPPCWLLSVTCGVAVPLSVKLLPLTVTSVPTGADAGLKDVIMGALARVTLSLADDVLPATSLACAVMVFEPKVRVAEQLKDPL